MKPIKKSDRNKPWFRKRPEKAYNFHLKKIKKSFLIICEGINTEPKYFEAFPLNNVKVRAYGLGQSKTTLVKSCLEIKKKDEDAQRQELWVVFDMDVNPEQSSQLKEDFNNAIELAQTNNIYTAYSNDAFELWFLLHYQYFDSQISRHEYYEKLSKIWGCNYSKSGKQIDFCRKIYQRLQEDKKADQTKAIKRAEQLLNTQKDFLFSEQNPCTTVFQLVKELNEYL